MVAALLSHLKLEGSKAKPIEVILNVGGENRPGLL